MKNLLAVVCLVMCYPGTWAQTNPRDLNERIIAESRGACVIAVNPHSYGCNDWTFRGNNIFPLFNMDWFGRLQGSWAMVTYADPQGDENSGPEFIMLKTKNRNTVPAGVFDVKSGRVVGVMRVLDSTMNFENWQGTRLSSHPGSFSVLDNLTVQMQAVDSQRNIQLFTCRDFNRQNTHHLLCRWDSRKRNASKWQHKGYLGFLRTGN